MANNNNNAQFDWNNPLNYKKCSKKQYEIHVCMPPKNTIVINKYEQADVVKALGGREYFTVKQVEEMQQRNPQQLAQLQQLVAQGRAYAVTDATPFVLAGTKGELWTISADKLAQTYTFIKDGQPLPINQQTLNARLKQGQLDWNKVRTAKQAQAGQNMACFVKSSFKGQIQTSWGSVLNINGVGVSHGSGDFVVCAMLPNGQPNMADRWVVNGDIFAKTYNNTGFTDVLSASSTASPDIITGMLPKLCIGKFEEVSNVSLMECYLSDVCNLGVCGDLRRKYKDKVSIKIDNPANTSVVREDGKETKLSATLRGSKFNSVVVDNVLETKVREALSVNSMLKERVANMTSKQIYNNFIHPAKWYGKAFVVGAKNQFGVVPQSVIGVGYKVYSFNAGKEVMCLVLKFSSDKDVVDAVLLTHNDFRGGHLQTMIYGNTEFEIAKKAASYVG